MKLKTKSERRVDKPLAETPKVERPITDIKSAITDINTRSAARMKAISDSQVKLDSDNEERNKSRRSLGESRIQGLASLHNTLGRQYYKQPASENS